MRTDVQTVAVPHHPPHFFPPTFLGAKEKANETMTTMEDANMQVDNGDNNNLQLNSQSMTIDPSVVQSRILQSASIQKAQQAERDDQEQQPHFAELTAVQASGGKIEYRRVRCPPHRYTPLREHWEQILTPLVEYLKLQVSLLRAS